MTQLHSLAMHTKYHPSLLLIGLALALCCCSRAPTGRFDLQAVSITYQPNPVHVGDKVVFDHVVRNNSATLVRGGTYDIDIYLDGECIDFDHATSDIPPGGETFYTMTPGYFHWQPTKTGRYHYRFVVAVRNAIRQHSGTNNVLEGDIDVLP